MEAGQYCELFREAMKREGIATNAEIVADGKIHRLRAEGDKRGTQNGWYVLDGEPYPVAASALGSSAQLTRGSRRFRNN
jgi:phage/plasmid primase-like uncharacterized protein